MGIPSYFTHIVRCHREIIKKHDKTTKPINNLYMDCNSIIYDAVNSLQQYSNNEDFEKRIIYEVCNKIIFHIQTIQPSSRVMIAFDGVAPVAKLTQQKTRRYKSWFQNKLLQTCLGNVDSAGWSTSSITPGTQFMDKLGKCVKDRFSDHLEFNVEVLVVSTSSEPGEGEHKIFEYIRNNKAHHANTKTVIYGLDADLIMLVLNNLYICKDMYLYRETPHFIKSIDNTLDPNKHYLMDIPQFAKVLSEDLNGGKTPTTAQEKYKMFDYILLCFFLGNDFLPHFPALNIRTSGIDRLMNVYKEVLGKKNENLTDGIKINWKNMRKLISVLSQNEHEYIKQEYISRDKFKIHNNTKQEHTTDKEKIENELLLLPMKERKTEKYINPFESGWQKRYYKTLFDIDIDIDIDNTRKKQICINYLEGLEWTMKYYTSGCVDWRWSYKYDYPPLLSDLIQYVPYFDTQLIVPKEKAPLNELVQLSYVLPNDNLSLLPKKIHHALISKFPEWYDTNYKFEWSFCKYFWEAHVKMPEIDINELEKIIN